MPNFAVKKYVQQTLPEYIQASSTAHNKRQLMNKYFV